MSSTNKTEYLGLNSWVSTDMPKRVDFNDDNSKIDQAMKTHCGDKQMHVTDADRQRWDCPYFMGYYHGDGQTSRVVETECPFLPSFGIVLAGGMPPSAVNFSMSMKNNYFAFIGIRTGTSGVSFSGTSIKISSNGSPVIYNEYMNLNISGVTYCYIFFR